ESHATGNTAYAFTDSSRPALGTVYYRVRFADVSGRESLSQTRKLAVDEETPLVRAFPNPFSQGPLTLLMEGLNAEQPAVVFVYNLAGIEVAKFATYPNLPNGLLIDQLPKLSQGFYSVKVQQGTLRSSTRLIIQ
ncbi:MAG: T9SS type A sorting domain-containing protein, partial [Bacteroidota bacterium]